MSNEQASGVATPDELAIRRLIEGWAIWRDTGDWERLLSAWHPGGRIVTTWFEGAAEDFIAHCKKAWSMGSVSQHILGGGHVRISRARALAQTRMQICVRATLDGIECDATCTGRFYDFFQRVDGRWGLALRSLVYEKDRLDPVDPGRTLVLDESILARFPVGYRRLAYLQTKNGQTVSETLPGLRGPAVERLYARGEAWLNGEAALP